MRCPLGFGELPRGCYRVGVEILARGTALDPGDVRVPGVPPGSPIVVERALGECPHGFWYEAAQDRQPMLLTVLDPILVAQADVRARIQRDVERAAAIGHRNLLPSFGLGSSGVRVFVAEQWPGGGTVREFAKQRAKHEQPIDAETAYALLAHVCNALTALGEVHGYVTADTVHVSREGRVMLAASGIGPSLPRARGFARFRAGGLLPCVSPELLDNAAAAGPPTDVYGVASLFVELVTGQSVQEAGPSPDELGLDDASLAEVLAKALDADPVLRQPTPARLKQDLAQVLAERRMREEEEVEARRAALERDALRRDEQAREAMAQQELARAGVRPVDGAPMGVPGGPAGPGWDEHGGAPPPPPSGVMGHDHGVPPPPGMGAMPGAYPAAMPQAVGYPPGYGAAPGYAAAPGMMPPMAPGMMPAPGMGYGLAWPGVDPRAMPMAHGGYAPAYPQYPQPAMPMPAGGVPPAVPAPLRPTPAPPIADPQAAARTMAELDAATRRLSGDVDAATEERGSKDGRRRGRGGDDDDAPPSAASSSMLGLDVGAIEDAADRLATLDGVDDADAKAATATGPSKSGTYFGNLADRPGESSSDRPAFGAQIRFFVRRDDKEYGPYSQGSLRDMIRSGRVRSVDVLRAEDSTETTLAVDVAGLREACNERIRGQDPAPATDGLALGVPRRAGTAAERGASPRAPRSWATIGIIVVVLLGFSAAGVWIWTGGG